MQLRGLDLEGLEVKQKEPALEYLLHPRLCSGCFASFVS